MSKMTDTEFFLKKLGILGGSAGNKALRENLRWTVEKYFRVRKILIEQGIVERGRGKGGSVYLLGDGSDKEAISTDEVKIQKLESDHYPGVEKRITNQLNQDFEHVVIEETARQGRKQLGGKWMCPDFLAITVQKFDYILYEEFTLSSYEIKRSDVVDISAVAEAAAHQRLAQLAYLVIVPHGDDKTIFDPTNVKRRNIEKECLKSGVGLILIPDYNVDLEIELAVEPMTSNIGDRVVNSTIGLLFSAQKREEIKKLITARRAY
jgi:hypothetical protein